MTTSSSTPAQTASAPIVSSRKPGRALLALGLVLPFLGIAAFMAQVFWLKDMSPPWYIPVAGVLGLGLVVAALWKARTIWRVAALVVVILVLGGEGAMVFALRCPEYTGVVKADQAFPAFSTLNADGTPFTERDLRADQDNVLVAFRGRW